MIYPWLEPTWAGIVRMVPKLPHALLIHGPAGVGKLSLAEELARLLLCEAGDPEVSACGRCEGCKWFGAGSHPDLRWLQPESHRSDEAAAEGEEPRGRAKTAKPSTEIRVDEVRDLSAFLNIGSHRARRRIVLVHPAESMNLHAANSLLKSLEEPPSGAMFILVSDRPARLLPTIRSRCVPVPVPLPEARIALRWLEAQGLADAPRWLAFAGGAPLLALQYAVPEARDLIARLMTAAAGDVDALGAVGDREALELLAEVLQKNALDNAFAASGGNRKYGSRAGQGATGPAAAWLEYARRMGVNRVLASHPLNPRLFAADMLGGMPKGR